VCCFFFLFLAYSAQGMVIGSIDNASEASALVENELCTPAQWEGFSTSWYPELDTLAMSNISYDYQNKKLAIDVEKIVWQENGEHDIKTYSMIFRFDKKKAFFFHDSPDGKNCTVKELDHDFDEWCVPADAKTMGPYTIGGSLKINAYKFNYTKTWHRANEDPKAEDTWFYYESTKDGIPVSAKYGSEDTKGISDWYDITAGIDDPSRFDPPDFCASVTPSPWRHGQRGEPKEADRPRPFSLWKLPFRV